MTAEKIEGCWKSRNCFCVKKDLIYKNNKNAIGIVGKISTIVKQLNKMLDDHRQLKTY